MSGTINVSSAITGTINFPQTDYNNTNTTSRFYLLANGSAGTFTNSVGAYTWGLTGSDLDNLTQLWAAFVNGDGSTTQDEKLANGAALGVNGRPTISIKGAAQNIANYSVPPQAQRELKWRITMQDTVTGEFYTSDVGCCNASILTNNNEQLPTAAKEAFEAFLAGPEITAVNDQLTPPSQDFNLPIIRSNRGNPLRYVTSSVVGVRFKRN